MPPDIYVNEMPVPQEENFTMPDFVLGFVGEFDRGPINILQDILHLLLVSV